MIYTFFEQLTIAVKFILLGLFLSIMLDVLFVFNFKKKVLNIITQIIFWIILSYIICNAVLVISKGYLPIYTFLFFLLGYFIYIKLLKKDFIKILLKLKSFIKNNRENIIMFFYPREVFNFIKKVLRKLKKIFKNIIKKLKKIIIKRKKEENMIELE